MQNVVLFVLEDDAADRENNLRTLRISRRLLRDTSDPFSINENQFRELYRFTKDTTRVLIQELRPFMPERMRNTGIPNELQILASINFMASGSYQRRVGQDFLTCMSQTAVSTALHATVNSLNNIMDTWIEFPVTAERRQRIKEVFFEHARFPGVIGAVDGSHIAIYPPERDREHLFINRKLYHSLNVLVSDYDGVLLAVNSSHGGRTHDARVLRSSQVFAHLQEHNRQGEIHGDSAYPLLPFLLTPLLNQPDGSPGARYTDHHIHARTCVERCFGVLKGRWRCLKQERALHYRPEFAALIVNACCVLHNMAVRWGVPNDDIYLDDIDYDLPALNNDRFSEENGEQTRNRVIQWNFVE